MLGLSINRGIRNIYGQGWPLLLLLNSVPYSLVMRMDKRDCALSGLMQLCQLCKQEEHFSMTKPYRKFFPWLGDGSRTSREAHVQFCEGAGGEISLVYSSAFH